MTYQVTLKKQVIQALEKNQRAILFQHQGCHL
jgi:hypothetical protein